MLKSSYTDPLIPLHESNSAELTRLSLNITTLTSLIEDSEHRGMQRLAAMFTRSRQSKVEQARDCSARSE